MPCQDYASACMQGTPLTPMDISPQQFTDAATSAPTPPPQPSFTPQAAAPPKPIFQFNFGTSASQSAPNPTGVKPSPRGKKPTAKPAADLPKSNLGMPPKASAGSSGSGSGFGGPAQPVQLAQQQQLALLRSLPHTLLCPTASALVKLHLLGSLHLASAVPALPCHLRCQAGSWTAAYQMHAPWASWASTWTALLHILPSQLSPQQQHMLPQLGRSLLQLGPVLRRSRHQEQPSLTRTPPTVRLLQALVAAMLKEGTWVVPLVDHPHRRHPLAVVVDLLRQQRARHPQLPRLHRPHRTPSPWVLL